MGEMTLAEVRRKRLAEFRARYDSDAAAADMLGITPNWYGQLKRGKAEGGRDISEKTARKLERAAGLPPGWFDGKDEDVGELSEVEKKLVTRFRRLAPDVQAHLLGWMAIQRSMTPTTPMASQDELETDLEAENPLGDFTYTP